MKKAIKLFLALLVTLPMSALAANGEQYVPSNWGGWQNLSLGTTDITYYTSDQLPMDMQVSGQTVHVAWTDWKPNAAGEYCLWYRRSTDAGKTWEEPQAIVKSTTMKMTDINYVGGNFGSNAKWMEVEGQDVHFVNIIKSVTSDEVEQSQLLYTYSHDGGATFQQRVLAESSQEEGFYKYRTFPYGRPHVEADGQTVVIAFQYSNNGYKTRVLTSFDGGQTFNNKLIDNTQELVDLKVSGRQWAVLGNDMYWYYNMHWGNVYISTSSDGGETITTQNVAPLVKDDTSWCSLEYMRGFNGQSFNYHAQMTLEGDVINVIFQGCAEDQGDPHPTNDRNHTIFRRSTDFGKTWTKAMYLPESKNTYCAIAAKGQNVYVLSTPNGPRMYHSHDGGQTWETQPRCFWNSQYSDNSNFYDLYLAPDDPTGQHVYLTACRGLLVESKDGFRTVHRNLALGYESWYGGRGNNHSLTVRLDSEGTEHWVMNYQAPYKPFDPYFWSIVYRRNDPAPATTGQEMALDISVPETRLINYPLTNVTIPMTPSIMETREAMTVECWVRIDKRSGGTHEIAALSNSNPNHGGSIYRGGWYIEAHEDGNQGYSFYAGLSTDLSVDAKGKEVWDRWRYRVTEEGTWHHLALTYDSRVEQDNIRFYVDGLLMGTQTERGPVAMGNNPIVIGPNIVGDYHVNETYVDNFALYSRALSHEEIMQHIYAQPDAKDKDCRLLLTFDGSLQDQSQYHNDPAPLLENYLKAHDGIRPPHPEFTLTKDLTGQTIYMTDMTQDGQAYQWIKPDPWNLNRFDKYSTSKNHHEKQDVSGHPGQYNYWMIAKGDGKTTNAYVATQQSILVGGLSRVFPDAAAPSDAVRLRIQGGYSLTYSKQPKVVLKQGTLEIEGKWLIDRDYNSSKVTSPTDLAEAQFDLREAKLGHYDVIVANDTLKNGFELLKGDGYPDVLVEVSGRDKMLWGKYQQYSIDFANRSNVAAYNIPFFLFISDNDGMVDVSFDFPIECFGEDIPQEVRDLFKEGEKGVVINTPQYGPMRGFLLNIPFIAPNGENHFTFRVSMKNGGTATQAGIDMVYGCGQPMGAYEVDTSSSRTKAGERDEWDDMLNVHDRWDSGLAECFGEYFYGWFKDTAMGSVPVVGCVYNVDKVRLAWKETHSWAVANLVTNIAGAAISCIGTVADIGTLGGSWILHTAVEAVWNGICNVVSVAGCLASSQKYRHLVGVRSYDPNEMIGPWGPDEERHYIKPIHQMPYMITFENKASASAPANEVFVTDTLDLSKLDAETFSFNGFGWADNAYTVGGSNNKEFTRDIEYKVNGHDILVRVSGQFDPETGIARWAFVSLEKNGNELDDIMNGFLLPNNDNGVGEGFVSFTIEHKANPANGSSISNRATIVFDANEPIVTNTYVNTFDTDYPTSRVTKAEEQGDQLVVTIEGSDKTSGIDHYTLYAFINDSTEPTLLATVADGSAASIACEPGTKYGLCAVATDRVGWNEAKELKAEKTITIGGSSATTYALTVADAGYATFFDSQNNYALPAGLKASTVSAVSGGRLSYSALSGSIVPKGTAVLIEASEKKAATYTLTSTSDAATYSGENLLHGSDEPTTTATDGQNLFYKLAYGPSGTSLAQSFGWFWGAQQGTAFRIEGHRAWLAVPQGAAARAFLIDGEATDAVEYVAMPSQPTGQMVDLQGRPIDKPTQPGIYFQNGRKIVIR